MESKFSGLYKLALQLLIARSSMQDPVQVAALTRSLAEIPLAKPKHRVICIRMAIKANADIGNFGIAAYFIGMLLPHNLMDHAKLENMMAHCRARNLENANSPNYLCPNCHVDNPGGLHDCSECKAPLNILCHKTLARITTPTLYRCDHCEAAFSVAVGQGETNCPVCSIGNLVEMTIKQ